MEEQRAGVYWGGTVARGGRTLRVQRGALEGLAVDLPNRRGAREQWVVSRARSDSVVKSAAAVPEPDVAVEHVGL
jgi:hypothetical protein